MRVYAIATRDNDKTSDCDIVFIPGAERVRKAYHGGSATFHNALPYPANLKDFLSKIDAMPPALDMFAYFGHGFNTQLGNHIRTRGDIKMFADALGPKMNPGGSVIFYSCLAGTLGGFTTMLMNDLAPMVWVYGHTTTKHSFKNPDVTEVSLQDGPLTLADEFGPSLKAAWVESLERTDLWLRFPMMYPSDIMRELNSIRLVGTWSVPPSGRYVFTWNIKNGVYSNMNEIFSLPAGEVTDVSTGTIGTWEMLADELEISWNAVEKETWELPIEPHAQRVRGVSGLARRTARGKYGTLQG